MIRLLVLFLVAVLTACAPARFVQPLQPGERAVVFNVGGPLVGFAGTTIPMPLSAVTGGFGVREDLTAFGSLHTTALLFGTVQAEAGVVKSFAQPNGWIPGLSVSPVANLAVDVREGNPKLWPQLDLHAYWSPGDRHLLYTGVSNWFELAGTRAHGEEQPTRWIASPQIGYTFTRGRWDYTAEIKYLAPQIGNRDVAVDYVSPGERGAIGTYLGIARRF